MYNSNIQQARLSSEEQLSSASTSIDDKQFLLESKRGFKMPKKTGRWMKWSTTALVLNAILFVGGLSVWGHVVVLLKSLRCETTPETDHFEPDCKYAFGVLLR